MVCLGMSVILMAKSSFPRAEQPLASDLSVSSSSSRRRDLVFIVNPRGANGRTGREWKKLLPYLRSRLGTDCNICESMTSGPSHAIEITREAIREGADAVVAVGGDGTLHEVVNGFFWGEKPVYKHSKDPCTTALGLIPLGTGSDFARTFGWANDPADAIERLVKGSRSRIDVGVITKEGGDSHYFINVADIHLSAKAGYHASKYKKFGNLCYVIGALQAFLGHNNRDLKIRVNDGEWEVYPQVTALCIGNAQFFGGGMRITPNAHPLSGKLEVRIGHISSPWPNADPSTMRSPSHSANFADYRFEATTNWLSGTGCNRHSAMDQHNHTMVVTLQDFKWYDFVMKMHRLYNGTHLSVNNVLSRSAFSIEVEEVVGTNSIHVQSDGEHLGFLPRKFSILPAFINMIC